METQDKQPGPLAHVTVSMHHILGRIGSRTHALFSPVHTTRHYFLKGTAINIAKVVSDPVSAEEMLVDAVATLQLEGRSMAIAVAHPNVWWGKAVVWVSEARK